MRIGNGYDVHKLVPGRDLIIGGVHIDHDKGLLGHSDADVLSHAIMDSLLGAMAKRDIGYHFPDTDPQYKDISSLKLLEKVMDIVNEDYIVLNIDTVIACQKPKLSPYIDQMKTKLSNIMDINKEQISIKATTTEKLGFVGREEGIESYAVSLLKRKEKLNV